MNLRLGRPLLYTAYGQDMALLNTAAKRFWVLVLGVAAVSLPFILEDDLLVVLATAFVAAIGAIGLNLVTGYAGQVSLGHAFFLAIGAYTAAALSGDPDSTRLIGFGITSLPVWLLAAGLVAGLAGLIVAAALTQATGTAERKAAEEMIVRHSPGARRITPGADKGYNAAAFLADMRALNVTPHIAQNISGRRSAVDARTTRHAGYAVSQRKRKRIEEPFGWGKTIGGLARLMLRGVEKLGFKFTLTMAGYNLIRLPKLIAAQA